MSAEQAQREPTMEEILASIRRIISEEDKPAEAGGDVLDLQPPPPPVAEVKAPAAPAPKPEPAAARALPPVPPEPEIVVPPLRSIEEDLMIVEDEEPLDIPTLAPAEQAAPLSIPPLAPAPTAEVAPPAAPALRYPAAAPTETLTSAPVAQHAAGALGKLMGSMLVSSTGTLDDVVRELLKPMLKEWLDANLPQLVEAEVAKEIDRIRRLAR
mgnify:CR=1 FL=1